MDILDIRREIEQLFASVDPQSLRDTTRRLERLVRQLPDAAERAQYESAIDHLPDMVKHLG